MLSWIKNNQNYWKCDSCYLAVCLPPCHSTRSWRRSRRIHVRVINPRPLEVGVTVADGGWVTGKSAFPHLSSAQTGIFSPGRSLSFAKWDSGFCNSGQALRAEWHEGEVRDWKKKSVFLNVQLQRAENELPMFDIKLMNQYPLNTALDSLSLLIGLLSQKIFSLRGMPPTLSFCAEPKAKSQNPSSKE